MPDNSATEKKNAGKAGAKRPVKKTSASKKKQVVSNNAVQSTSDKLGKSLSLTLDSVLTINRANELHSQYAAVLRKKCDVLTIDASSVQMVDTAIIQLLYGLVIALKANGSSVNWLSPSPEFSIRVRSLGMAQKLCLVDGKSE